MVAKMQRDYVHVIDSYCMFSPYICSVVYMFCCYMTLSLLGWCGLYDRWVNSC